MKKSGESHSNEITTTKGLDSDLTPKRRSERKPSRRKIKPLSFSSAGVRRRREDVLARKTNGPATPLSRWKFSGGHVVDDARKLVESGDRDYVKGQNAEEISVSARKLAAGLWHLQLPIVPAVGRLTESSDRLKLEAVSGRVSSSHLCKTNFSDHRSLTSHSLGNQHPLPRTSNGTSYEIEPLGTFENSATERATKGDPPCSRAPGNRHLKLLECPGTSSTSLISALQTELEEARARIDELETERRLSQKKLDHFLKKLAEEKSAWKSKEQKKNRALIEDIKDDLNRERKTRQRVEIVNCKLVNELAEAKLTVKRLLLECEKERKARELMEEVCDELAKEIGQDKAEGEALRQESMRIREEVEEERKMLQMAEVWREERVQMKLVDAKLTLEEKYAHLSRLISEVEEFLRARGTAGDRGGARVAELLKAVARTVNIQDLKGFTYQPSTSDDLFSFLQEIQSGAANDRSASPSVGSSPLDRMPSNPSDAINGCNGQHTRIYSNGYTGRNRGGEEDDASEWETVSQGQERSSFSGEGSYPSVNGHLPESSASGDGNKWEITMNNETSNTDLIRLSSVSEETEKRSSSISRLWKSGYANRDGCKAVSEEISNGRLSNVSADGSIITPTIGRRSSPLSAQPVPRRGMKGCIEWPRAAQKDSLKTKLLEARLESQKIQLRQALKQKI